VRTGSIVPTQAEMNQFLLEAMAGRQASIDAGLLSELTPIPGLPRRGKTALKQSTTNAK